MCGQWSAISRDQVPNDIASHSPYGSTRATRRARTSTTAVRAAKIQVAILNGDISRRAAAVDDVVTGRAYSFGNTRREHASAQRSERPRAGLAGHNRPGW